MLKEAKKVEAAPNKGAAMLKRWLEKKGLSQNDCSDILDISFEHVSRLMSGFYKPGLALACKIDETCGVPPHAWLDELI